MGKSIDKKKLLIMAAVLVCVAMVFAFTGCGSEDEYTDDADFTVDYLNDEYPEQLMADGAETTLGSVSIKKEETDNGANYILTIVGKEIVLNPDYEEGYYIAETNVVKDCGVGGYAKFVYYDENGEEVVGDAESFMLTHPNDPDLLYTVYCINDNAELLLPVDPAEIKVKN